MERGKENGFFSDRLGSLDAFRGLIMIILISKGFGLYLLADNQLLGFLGKQFTHYEGFGVNFQDLIMPFFLFIAGVAIPYCYLRRWEKGQSWAFTFRHALNRFLLLFLLGILIYSLLELRPVFAYSSLFAQLGGCCLAAFLLLRLPVAVQVGMSFGLLLLNHLLEQLFPIPGFTPQWMNGVGLFTPFIEALRQSVGTQGAALMADGMDKLVNSNNICFTVWGVAVGLFIRNRTPSSRKAIILAVTGVTGIVCGDALSAFIPFSKKLCSGSFMLFSGGWSLLAFALLYWIIDLRGHRQWAHIPMVAGMNSLFLYSVNLFAEGVGEPFLISTLPPAPNTLTAFVLFAWLNLSLVFLVSIVWTLYQRRILIKI